MTKKATNFDLRVKEFLLNALSLGSRGVQGIGCTDIGESLPKYEEAQCEKVYSGKNNTYLVLGRDRPGGEFSGCGGRGDTQCGMIDLVAGRISSTMWNQLEKNPSKPIDSDTVVDNNFFADAARVYITQKAINIDDYLGFQNIFGSDPSDLSAVVVKSDCTRIVGRESVRIYAGGGAGDGFGSFGEPRADGTDISKPKIELIVGNQGEDDMQPAVMGNNLISYMKKNNEINRTRLKIFQKMINQLSQIHMALIPLSLGSYTSLAAKNMVENIEIIRLMLTDLINETLNDCDHLDDAIIPGAKSILSKKVFIT
jgi:hypothetical protein